MPAPDPKTTLHNYLRTARQALLWKLAGLSEYDLRRPLTPTGTNLLGVLKHVASVELGYFTDVFGRPSGVPLPWFAEDAEPNADMWATAEETHEQMVALYHRSWELADATIEELPLDAPGNVPWWGEERSAVTLHQILVHMVVETNRHLGQVDIVRELIDGATGYRDGNDNMAPGDAAWWSEYRVRLDQVARRFRPDGSPLDVREMRVARPARDLAQVVSFWVDTVGLAHLGGFTGHNGYDGVFVGPPGREWHLEFTRHGSGEPVPTPTDEDLLVLYLAVDELERITARLAAAGHSPVDHANPYWAGAGALAFRDPDGYLLVVCPTG